MSRPPLPLRAIAGTSARLPILPPSSKPGIGPQPVSLRSLARLAETLLVAAGGGLLLDRLGLPAGFVSGSVLAVAVAALLGRPMAVPPNLTRIVLVVIGIALGSVVTPATLAALLAYPASIALLACGTLTMMAGTALYLKVVHGWSGLSALLGAARAPFHR